MATLLSASDRAAARLRMVAEVRFYAHLLAVQPIELAAFLVQIPRWSYPGRRNVFRPHPDEPCHTPLGEAMLIDRLLSRRPH